MSETTPTPTPANDLSEAREETMRRATEIAVRLGAIAIVVAWCLQIIAPFVGIVIWGLIIAVALQGPYDAIARRVGGRRQLAAAIIVLLGIAVVVVPAVLLSETLVSGAQNFAEDIADGSMDIPPPPSHVVDWPIVGEPVFEFWSLASRNLKAALEKLGPQLQAVSAWLLKAAAAVGAGLLQMIVSLVIAGVMLSRSGVRAGIVRRLASRLAGPEKGPALAELARATISSVVNGIVGVALIQSLLSGIGFVLADVPAAGLWALFVLVAAVVQIPAGLVMVLPIMIVFSTASTTVAIVFTAWCVFVSLADNVLKPMLFGRGVELPMIVIFLGAIGGMLTMGIIGLFVGAVVLGVGYELFNAWIDADADADADATAKA
ncbi:MAG: AI-2E family transporter [Deltaproteobacteria bacterium]|nr:AI-2E family transporter [Deltaproteobacteria bacterium]